MAPQPINGILQITAKADGSYFVIWWPVVSQGGARPCRNFGDAAELKRFLEGVLGIDEEQVAHELKLLQEARSGERSYAMREVWLSDDQAKAYGLASC